MLNKSIRFIPSILVILFLFSTSDKSFSQAFGYYQPQVTLGGSVALFRISLDDFENIYTNRVGVSYGGFAGARLYSSYYALFKYRSFRKNGKEGTHPQSGLNLQNARWDEKWMSLGLRVQPPITNKFHNYYGFGVAFFQVDEVPGIAVYQQDDDNDDLGTGFYLEMGLAYFPIEKLSTFFEIEIASGGVRGKTGFEAFSVGGYRFAVGISFWPF